MELVLHKPWASRRGLSTAAVPAARGPETPLGPAHPQGRWEKEQSRNRLLQPLTFKAHALPLFWGEALLGENDCPGLAKCCSQSSRYGEQGTAAGKHSERVTWDRPLERGEAWLAASTLVRSYSLSSKAPREMQHGAEDKTGL